MNGGNGGNGGVDTSVRPSVGTMQSISDTLLCRAVSELCFLIRGATGHFDYPFLSGVLAAILYLSLPVPLHYRRQHGHISTPKPPPPRPRS